MNNFKRLVACTALLSCVTGTEGQTGRKENNTQRVFSTKTNFAAREKGEAATFEKLTVFGSRTAKYDWVVDPNKNTTRAPATIPIQPGKIINTKVHQYLAYTMLAIFSTLTLVVGNQIFRIWYYGHRKRSYSHTVFLLLLFWGILRLSLLVVYAIPHETITRQFHLGSYLLFFVAPPVLQFAALSIMALYFTMVSLAELAPEKEEFYQRVVMFSCILVNTLLVSIQVWSAVHHYLLHDNSFEQKVIYETRVFITEGFTVLLCVLWMTSVFRLRRLVDSRIVLEGNGVTVRQAVILTCEIVFLLFTRTIYNLLAVKYVSVPEWGYRLSLFSHSKDSKDDGSVYVFTVAAMLLWEITPVVLVVSFFRVPKLYSALPSDDELEIERGAVFFDASEDEDSDGDLSSSGISVQQITSPVNINPYEFWGQNTNESPKVSSYYDIGSGVATP
eukprot:m.66959 g.66959  ORF g.66959 m.66959 type:complete len:445 (+) comp11848_c0_seq3:319-1653(+)